jgi:RNA polymerase sigma factor (sigma-70 family)
MKGERASIPSHAGTDMPASDIDSVIHHLRRAALLDGGAGLTDGQLLDRFVSGGDAAAIEVLVRRHAPMVWGTVRRVLRSHHDAEDAFQATFLVLARKAASVVPREMVANWLYGVARQTALKARATAARRRGRERQVERMPEPPVAERDRWGDLVPLLDQELGRLPDKYRAAVVLCDLEGKTRKEVARQLGLPEGTVGSRLARARAMLAKRLTERGVTLSAGALAAVLAQNVASAGVPDSVVSSTISVAPFFAAGASFGAGPVSGKVAALTEGVLKAMMISKLKAVVAVVLVLGLIATGAIALCHRMASAQGAQPPAVEVRVKVPQKQEKEKEAFTAWGKEVGGLQAGLGFRPGGHRVYYHGETAKVVLRVRNVGKEAVELKYIWAFFVENPPTITDADGKTVQLPRGSAEGLQMPRSTKVPSGKEVDLYEWEFALRPQGERSPSNTTIHGTGRFSLQCERVVGPTSANPNHPNPTLSKLATGKLELDVKDAEKALQKEVKENEGFTAWGQEAGGLQAGLGYRAGGKRVYHHGETVHLVVRVRNVGTKAVKFEYLPQFLTETPPTVIDSQGKSVPSAQVAVAGLVHRPVEVTVAPGKEIELYEMIAKLEPEPADDDSRNTTSELHGAGKFQIQYDPVLGNSSAGTIKVDPALSKLATGKLELEIKSDPSPAATEKPTLPKASPPKVPGADFKIEASAKGMEVRAAGFQGSALRISYDDVNGVLVLEGKQNAPATLVRSLKGRNQVVRAVKIVYSLTDGTLRAESVGALR